MYFRELKKKHLERARSGIVGKEKNNNCECECRRTTASARDASFLQLKLISNCRISDFQLDTVQKEKAKMAKALSAVQSFCRAERVTLADVATLLYI